MKKQHFILVGVVLISVSMFLFILLRETFPDVETAELVSIVSLGNQSSIEPESIVFDPAPLLDKVATEKNLAVQTSLEDDLLREAIGIHEWQKDRLTNVSSETIPELIAHLGNFDDMNLADLELGGGVMLSLQEPETVSQLIPRLIRVRRLLKEAERNPDEVLPKLRAAYDNAVKGWSDAVNNFMGKFDSQDFVPIEEDDPYHVYEYQAAACQYMLAELGDTTALPIYWRDYIINEPRTPDISPDHRPRRSMVPIPNTLTAIHRLISKCPEDELDESARKARERFLMAADEALGIVEYYDLPAWNTKAWPGDPRFLVMGVEDTSEYETVQIAFHPYQFANGEEIAEPNRVLSPKAVTLFGLAEEFIRSAFPSHEL